MLCIYKYQQRVLIFFKTKIKGDKKMLMLGDKVMRWYDMITERVSIRYLLLLCDIKIFSLRKFLFDIK